MIYKNKNGDGDGDGDIDGDGYTAIQGRLAVQAGARLATSHLRLVPSPFQVLPNSFIDNWKLSKNTNNLNQTWKCPARTPSSRPRRRRTPGLTTQSGVPRVSAPPPTTSCLGQDQVQMRENWSCFKKIWVGYLPSEKSGGYTGSGVYGANYGWEFIIIIVSTIIIIHIINLKWIMQKLRCYYTNMDYLTPPGMHSGLNVPVSKSFHLLITFNAMFSSKLELLIVLLKFNGPSHLFNGTKNFSQECQKKPVVSPSV